MEPDFPHFFSQNLKALKKKNGFTQKELSQRVGVNVATISDYERGATVPNLKILLKLMACFGFQSIDEFVFKPHYVFISSKERQFLKECKFKVNQWIIKGKQLYQKDKEVLTKAMIQLQQEVQTVADKLQKIESDEWVLSYFEDDDMDLDFCKNRDLQYLATPLAPLAKELVRRLKKGNNFNEKTFDLTMSMMLGICVSRKRLKVDNDLAFFIHKIETFTCPDIEKEKYLLRFMDIVCDNLDIELLAYCSQRAEEIFQKRASHAKEFRHFEKYIAPYFYVVKCWGCRMIHQGEYDKAEKKLAKVEQIERLYQKQVKEWYPNASISDKDHLIHRFEVGYLEKHMVIAYRKGQFDKLPTLIDQFETALLKMTPQQNHLQFVTILFLRGQLHYKPFKLKANLVDADKALNYFKKAKIKLLEFGIKHTCSFPNGEYRRTFESVIPELEKYIQNHQLNLE